MSKFVIRRNTDGKFLKGGRSYYSDLDFVDSMQNARVYDRRCDASNSMREHFEKNTYTNGILEIVPVVLIQPAY